MKIRITDPGFANYTGQFGAVNFVDGVSEEIGQFEAQRLGSIVRVVVEGTDENPSVTQQMVTLHNKNLEEMGIELKPSLVEPTSTPAEELIEAVKQTAKEKAEQKKAAQAAAQAAAAAALTYDFTFESLSKVADTQGIAGLRTVAEPYGVRGQSVSKLIQALLALKAEKGPKEQAAAPEAATTEQVTEQGDEEVAVEDDLDDLDDLNDGFLDEEDEGQE